MLEVGRGAKNLLVALLTSLSLAGCAKKSVGPSDPTEIYPDLPVVSGQINASQGGVIKTDDYRVEFPAGSLSEDSNVKIGAPDEDPNYPVSDHLDQSSSFLNVDIGSASLIDTCYLYFPYSDYDNDNPPMPFVFDSDGSAVDIVKPFFENGEVKVGYFPSERNNGWTAGLQNFVDYVQEPNLYIPENFDWNSDEKVILLIHGLGGSADIFMESGMYGFLNYLFPDRVWMYEYPSVLSVSKTASMLEEKIADLQVEYGFFPFNVTGVGHSMGGLLGREYIRNRGYEVIDNFIFLGTPNNGTTLEAAIYHLLHHPERGDWWFNTNSTGFQDCLTFSPFLLGLNTPTSEMDVTYYMIAGNYSQGSPVILGSDDHLVSTESVDLHNFSHENVHLTLQQEVDVIHGKLIEDKDGIFNLLELILTGDGEQGVIYVDDDNPDYGNGSFFNPFSKIDYAVDVSEPGDKIIVFPGEYYSCSLYKKDNLSVDAVGGPELTNLHSMSISNGDDNLIRGFFAEDVSVVGNNNVIENCIFDLGISPYYFSIRGNGNEARQITLYVDKDIHNYFAPPSVRIWEGSELVSITNSIILGTEAGSLEFFTPNLNVDCSDFDNLNSSYNDYYNGGCGSFVYEVESHGECCLTDGYDSEWYNACDIGYYDFSLDPRLIDPKNGNYRLAFDSPCIDAGDPNVLDPDGSRSDLGAFGGPNSDYDSKLERLIRYQKSFTKQ